MSAEVQHRVCLPDLLQIGVVSGKTVVGACTTGIEQAHWVAFVAEGGLNANKDVAEMATKHQQVLAIAVEVAGGLAPVLFQSFGVRRQALVLLHAHTVCDRELGGSLHGIGVVDDSLEQSSWCGGQTLNVVALGLHLLHHPMDGAENIEVSRCADIAFVRREAEHGDRQLLVDAGLDPQGRPADGALCDGIHSVLQGVCLTCGVITA